MDMVEHGADAKHPESVLSDKYAEQRKEYQIIRYGVKQEISLTGPLVNVKN